MELDRLEHEGILTEVEYSDWGTSIIPKDKINGDIGDVRIYADYMVTLNKNVWTVLFPCYWYVHQMGKSDTYEDN